MPEEAELYYFCRPERELPVTGKVEFLTVNELLSFEPACKVLWDMVTTQFKTRSKFLQVWPNVRYVAVSRDPQSGQVWGFLLVTAAINWQIDYVTVVPEARGKKLATSLVKATLNEAFKRKVPYVMLTSREGLRSLYEKECGFSVVAATSSVPSSLPLQTPPPGYTGAANSPKASSLPVS